MNTFCKNFDCYAHHHLQQDPRQPQQHVEIRPAVSYHSGIAVLSTRILNF